MSKKPPKKSDCNKSWMKPRRDRNIIIAPEYHLIVTEGTKTEPKYFQGLKSDINYKYQNRISIDIEGVGQGANTVTLLERAVKIVSKEPDKYQHVWLVYDKDDFPEDDYDNTLFKCLAFSNESVTYHALWSNECVELWFLLHFIYLQSALHRTEYFPKLSEHLNSKYEKNRDDMYMLLKPHLKTAISNAKKLAEYHKELTPSASKPGTVVYEIFEKLQSYL